MSEPGTKEREEELKGGKSDYELEKRKKKHKHPRLIVKLLGKVI